MKTAYGTNLQRPDNYFLLYCIVLYSIVLDRIELNCVVFYHTL